MKKLFSFLLCGMLVAAAMTGCGGNPTSGAQSGSQTGSKSGSGASTESPKNENLTPAGTLPIVNEKITLKVTIRDGEDKAAAGKLDFHKWFEEQTNIHAEFTEIPANALAEKINLSLVSGSLPDVYLNCAITNVQQIQYGSAAPSWR